VRIVDQTIKLSYEPNSKLLEVHSPLTNDDGNVSKHRITAAVADFVGNSAENKAQLLQQIENPKGLVTQLLIQ
jgi:L,D-transpeptidase ErfK/SrfK/L,D-transpeptidase YbiS